MVTNTTTIAIAGITRTLARLITKHLLNRPNVHINILCYKLSKLPNALRSDPRRKIFQAEANDTKTSQEAIRKVDMIICCYLVDNTLMIDGQKNLVDACIDQGVPRYVAGDWSMDFRELGFGEHLPRIQ